MKKFFINKYFLTVLGIGLFFVLWYLIYVIAGQKQAIFPSPLETFKQMWVYLGEGYTYKSIWGSFKRMLIGFSVASIIAIIIGMFVGNFTKLKYVFNPTVIALKAIPTAALTFLFLVLAGLKNAPIFIVVLIVGPIVYEATVAGYSNIDDYVLKAARVDGASWISTNVRVKFPLALPTISLGMISSFALAFKIEIMAEVISGSSSYGLGRAIRVAYVNSDNGMVPTFAFALIAIIFMLLVTLLLDILKKVLKLKA